MTHLRYRADIDGLRAVAVLGVVIYHAFPQNLPGGFCGVDIFFVISGYLISGILYKGVREGGFSFREFYVRRIRRLFPALITVLLLCLGYGYFILLGDEYQQMGKHVAAGTLFIQNIVFWKESGYWDVASTLKPLLHLWSLAVEEQFYIIFPPLLLLFWKKKWPMVPLLWILLLVSLIANLIMSYQSRESDFYLTTYRAWEFLGGSLLAWWHYGKNHEEEAPYGNLLSVLGFILLVLSMIVLKEKEPYPGWRAILPVAGSIMLIAAGRKSWINSRILSHPAVVWIGLISYPLYLFHWPALSFVHIVKGEKPADIYLAGALVVAFLLTLATYYLIEKPIRFSKSRAIIPLLTAAFIITGLLGCAAWKGAIESRMTSDEYRLVQIALKDKKSMAGYHGQLNKDGILVQSIGGSGHQTLFLGDSFMQQYMPRIRALLGKKPDDSRGAIFVTCGGTPPIQGVHSDRIRECEGLMRTFSKILTENQNIDRVVIGGRWQLYFGTKGMYSVSGGKPLTTPDGREIALINLDESLKSLGKEKRVFVVLCSPTGKKLDPKNYIQRKFAGEGLLKTSNLSVAEWIADIAPLNDSLRKIACNNNAIVIDPSNVLTQKDICIREQGGVPIRYDDGHLCAGFVRDHVTYLDETVAP
jgi:peptidoglycan/LPS O-acetylase OafA/YrhL